MQCKKCHAENADTTIFCHQCGNKLSTGNIKQTILAILGSLVGLILIILVILWNQSNNPVDLFKTAIENNNYSEAIDIYDKKIKDTGRKESEVRIYLLSDIQRIKQELIDEKIDYSTASYRLDTIEKTNFIKLEARAAKDEIQLIHHSKNAFKAGEKYLKDKNLKEALIEFKYVDKLDPGNYVKAQKVIKERTTEYKLSALYEAEKLAGAENYGEAANLMSEALTIIAGDTDLKAKKDTYEKKHEEILAAQLKETVAKLKKKQKVIVVENSTFDDKDDTYLSITIKNNSNKTIKNYTVSWIGLNKYGRPVKTGWLGSSYLRIASEDYIIKPGKTAGSNFGWQVTGRYSESIDAVKYVTCVKEVKYEDGSTWNNEYYDYWVDEFIDEADQ